MTAPPIAPPRVPPYPHEADRVVHEAAQAQGHVDALQQLDVVRAMTVGDAGTAEARARAWAQTPFLGEAGSRVEAARTELAAYWEGAAHRSFDRYADGFVRLTDANGTAHGAMSGALQRTVETIWFSYGTALRFLAACSGAILKTEGNILGKLMPWDWLGVAGAVGDALNEFARNVGDLVRDVTRQEGQLRAQAVAFAAAAQAVDPPRRLPGAVPHVGNWDVSSAW